MCSSPWHEITGESLTGATFYSFVLLLLWHRETRKSNIKWLHFYTNKRMTENIFQDNKENLNMCIICLTYIKTYIKTPKLNIITLKAYNKTTYLAPLAKGARRRKLSGKSWIHRTFMGLAVSLLHTLFTDIKRHRNATGIRHMNYKKYTENVSIGTHHYITKIQALRH